MLRRILLITALFCFSTILEAQEPNAQKPNCLIGYTEGRNDSPNGQHANWVTKRAYVVRADGTHRKEIGNSLIRDKNNWTQFAGWSPDGQTAIVLSLWESPENAAWERENKTFRMTEGWLVDSYLWNLSTGDSKNVTAIDRVSNYNTVTYSADGSKLLMTSLMNGVSKPFLMEMDGSRKIDISNGGTGFSYGLSSTKDGKYVAYHENYQIYVSLSDGTDKKRIDTGYNFNFAPQWSKDGNWLMFVAGEHYNCHPYLVRKDGSEFRKLADRGGYRGVVETLRHPDFHSESSDLPTWDMNGESIIYSALVGDRVELMRTFLDGKTTQITKSAAGVRNYHPSISPDGKWLLFGSDRSGTMQLYVSSIDGQFVWPITNVPIGYHAMHGHWQPYPENEHAVMPPQIVTVAKSTPDFTRKSEGDVIELKDGRLLLVYMEFSGQGDDFAKTRLVAQESKDHGATWGNFRVITETLAGDMNVYSPNLTRSRDDAILLIFMRQHDIGSRTCFVWKSKDEGNVFEPFSAFAPKSEHSLCNATIKRLSSGRLILPTSLPEKGQSAATGPYEATTLHSDDDGKTWAASQTRITLPMRGAMEPHVEETGDGRILMVMRSQLGRLQFSESSDNGLTWSEAWASELHSPESCPELTLIPKSGHLLLIWNNGYDRSFRSHFGKRSPLTTAVSKDFGKTWQISGAIETDPARAFSNPGCRFTKQGKAIINYWTCEYLPDWRMQDVIDLRVAVVETDWLYGALSDSMDKVKD